MSSITWTAEELSSNYKKLSSKCWRVVEAQHINSTMKLVDSAEEQWRLEELLEESKPPYPEECKGFHWLLYTPFRYLPYPFGSRFRRVNQVEGVFYAAEEIETALAEKAYYSRKFYEESPETPLPDNPVQHTAFSISYMTDRGLDLTVPPLSKDESHWKSEDYSDCQMLADEARKSNCEVIKYCSVRCPNQGNNIAIMSPHAFSVQKPEETVTWNIMVRKDSINMVSEAARKSIVFPF